MSLFHRNEIAPNLGRRGRTPIAALDPGMFRLRLERPLTEAPIAPPAAAPAVERQEVAGDYQPRRSVDPFAQPPPDWRPEPELSSLTNVASPLDRSLGDEQASLEVSSPAEESSASPPAMEETAHLDAAPALGLGETAIAPQEVASLDQSCPAPLGAEAPTFAGQIPSPNGVPVAEPEVTRAPVRVLKLDLESCADLADAASAGAADDIAPSDPTLAARPNASIAWPWQRDRDVAGDQWRALLGLDTDTSEADCVRALCALTIPAVAEAQMLGPALRAGYAGEDSRAIRASLLAALADDPACPPEFWWCVASGSREPHERVLAYRAITRLDARAYAQALDDPQAWVALALGRRLLREQGVHDFERALASVDSEHAGLLRSALVPT